jgi:mannose-1-phosphate guanylyltransferase
MARVYAIIMAGGRGERFWPLSTEEAPKPFLPLLGSRTLLQETVNRLRPMLSLEQIFVSIGEVHEKIARQHLPELPGQNFIVEPVGRDTSACLGFCALCLEKRDPEAIMLALPADHYIKDAARFHETIRKGLESLAGAAAVVFGIRPGRPETGYGYVQAEKPAVPTQAWPVIRFVEKPDEETACRYLQAGNFFWNSGIFLWENRTLLELLRKHMPVTYEVLDRLRPMLDRSGAESERRRIYSSLPRLSIDYGILEKASGLRLVPAEFEWDDVGNWNALARMLAADEYQNVALGRHSMLDSSRCITFSDAGVIALFGVKDLVIVQAHGKTLVCARDRAADLKKLVGALAASTKRER